MDNNQQLQVTFGTDRTVMLKPRKLTVSFVEDAQKVKAQLLEHTRNSSAAKAMLEDSELWELAQASQGKGERFNNECEQRRRYNEEQNKEKPDTTELATKEDIEADVKAFFQSKMNKAVESNPALAKAYLFPDVELSYEPSAVKAMVKAVPQFVDTSELTEKELEELNKADINSPCWADMDVERLASFCTWFCKRVK